MPDAVRALVERFARNRDAYRTSTYNETQARREFIDPLFKALGWDVNNDQGLAEAYKDVIHEDAIKVGGVTKAPDYCFRIGGTRKFFLEAKRPGVNLKADAEPAYQLRRYAWSAKLPLSILTDFEEFAVYDCRIKPNRSDSASVARVLYLTCDQYADKWDEIAGLFSKDAVLKGSFDKYAESTRRKRGTAEVDDAFLAEIETWRDALARNFALRNPELSVRDLNFAVQRTIDRIIFLRMCEDRGIEPYGQLQALLNGSAVYERLAVLFRRADDKYNAGLFYFRLEPDRGPPDELTLALKLDDNVLKDILGRLYYPESPYEFSVLSADILGQVYEQFLGKVIRLTPAHRAVIEEKPEVRKAGGVYYTPTYIVDYIVKHTVGKLLEGQTPADVGPDRETKTGRARKLPKGAKTLRILDPACGSGSFLLGAYQYLLDWHRDRYVQDGPEKYRDRVYQGAGGQWRLTIREKKRILLNNIYGVDIDPQAVEVTKLSLLLKVLEGESAETVDSSLRLFHERALPDLARNIKCGNSLIGPDFYEGRQLDMFDEEERYRINAFDWRAEFPEVFPRRAPEPSRAREEAESGVKPSRAREEAEPAPKPSRDRKGAEHGRDREGAESRRARKEVPQRRASASVPETHPLPDGRGSDPTFAPDAGFDAVIGNPPWGQKEVDKCELLSRYLRSRYRSLGGIFDMFRPFVERGIELLRLGGLYGMVLPDIVLLKDYPDTRKYLLERLLLLNIDWWGMAFEDATIDTCTIIGSTTGPARDHEVAVAVHNPEKPLTHRIPQADFWANERFVFNLHLTPPLRSLLTKCRRLPVFADYFEVHEGVHSGNIRDRLFVERRLDASCRPMYFGRDEISPYRLCWHGKYIRVSALPKRRTKAAYANAGRPQWYDQPKVLVRRTGDYVLAAVDEKHRYASNNFFIAFPHRSCLITLHGLTCLLNSRFMTWFFRTIEPRTGRVFAELKIKHLGVFPLPLGDELAERVPQLDALGRNRAALAERIAAAKTAHEVTVLQRDIDRTDRQIDQLVYELYGLTEDEIRIVEEATQ